MNFSDYYGKIISRIYITRDASGLPSVHTCLSRLPDVPHRIIESRDELPSEHRDRSTLLLTMPRGTIVGRCPGTRGHLCCNYITVDLYMGCTIGCTYCIMKYYLNYSPITIYADTSPGIEAIRHIARKNPAGTVRIGTGEVGDSLQFDPLLELSAEYIDACSDLPNVHFELKTKTDFIDHLLGLKRKGNAVIGFSVNAETMIESEDGDAVPLDARIAAALKAVGSGYRVAFHFDPVFLFPGWQEAYDAVIRKLSAVPGRSIAWVSIGTFRYPPLLKDKIDDRAYLYGEFVPCKDGKFRYLQRIRTEMYRFLSDRLSEIFEGPVYLCMESVDVWKNVFGGVPRKLNSVRGIFSPVQSVRKHDASK